ncbi:carcinoembryonic antigen-related cell adhesion molecule 21-like [Artibeus jamaicensis]|uniref:carcinoembryonic antigen-related cell adhesion molecule 21-like n=1 Tax=Artibeus jamaicensis TaxID=9417 RepID=UPI00235A7F12|nr:carcinoembryonic antigen-related cell adhesion molecule 21-like [Artibeus jamaicensis]
MGSLSLCSHRGLVHWQGLLLGVSLLNFWCLPATEQLVIVSKNVTEGEDILLRIRSEIPDAASLKWYRGKGVNEEHIIAFFTQNSIYHIRSPAYGRVTVSYDGSLMLMNVTRNDTGIYTVVLERPPLKTLIGYRQLNVYEPVSMPTLLASKTTVTENKDAVVMTCYSNEISTQWLFNGMNLQLTERMKLSEDHRSLTIDPVKREDAGNYKCKVSNTIRSVESAPLVLTVKSE